MSSRDFWFPSSPVPGRPDSRPTSEWSGSSMAKHHDPNLPRPNPADQDPAKGKPPAPEDEEIIILDAADEEGAPGAPKARPTHLAPADAEAAPVPNAPNM